MGEYTTSVLELSQKLSITEVLDYYEVNKNLIMRKENVIRTIGVYYRRMYDGGVERVVSILLSIWIGMSYRVVLFTDEEPNERDYPYPEEVKRIVIAAPNNLRKRLEGIERGIKAEKIDVFIDNGWTSGSILFEMLLVKSMNIPFLLYTHGHFTALYASANEYAMNSTRVFALCDKIITLSEMNARFYQLCGCNVALVENPVPDNLRKAAVVQSEDNNHRVLWIGRIAEGKRFGDALKIFGMVRCKVPDVELDVVGTGTDESVECARRLCVEMGIEDAVHFHGYQMDVESWYKNSALMLMTSEKEGYPTVLLESKAYGRSCVMYSLPYLSLIKDGKGIRVAPIGELETMAEHIIQILLQPDLRHMLEKEVQDSFKKLCGYDLVSVWNNIFEEMGGIMENNIELPYDQDSMMVTMLLDTIGEGMKMQIQNSFEYQVGNKVLRYPRSIKRFLHHVKRGLKR